MANAYRDENNVPTLIACSTADGKTPVRLEADPTTHRLLVSLASTGQNAVIWGGTANSTTVTDAAVTASSFIAIMNNDTPAGRWKVVPTVGSFTITSSSAENSALTFSYKIIL